MFRQGGYFCWEKVPSAVMQPNVSMGLRQLLEELAAEVEAVLDAEEAVGDFLAGIEDAVHRADRAGVLAPVQKCHSPGRQMRCVNALLGWGRPPQVGKKRFDTEVDVTDARSNLVWKH
jgi:hypothetical protein